MSRPPGGLRSLAAAFGLLLMLAPPAAATGPSPDNPPALPGSGAVRPELPQTHTQTTPAPAPAHHAATTTRPVTPTVHRAAAAATVRTVVVTHQKERVSAPPRPRVRTHPRHVVPRPVRHTAPVPRLRSVVQAPDRRPPYGLVALAAVLAVLGAGSLAVTVSQVRAGAA